MRAKTPSELAEAERPGVSKQSLRQARDVIKGASLENLRESSPSFRSRANLKAQLNENLPHNNPNIQQMRELETFLRARSIAFAGAADSVAEVIAKMVTSADVRVVRNSRESISDSQTTGVTRQ